MSGMRVVRGMPRSLCIVLLLLTCGALSAQNDEHRIRNIVLVHGAWVDGSGWKGVYDILVKDGYNVSMVQEPETSFSEDVAAAKRVVAQQDGPCILVGHSYGGAVVTEVGTDRSVAGLVYVAAHMPHAGENEADDGKRFPSDLSKPTAIKKTADGLTNLDPAQFREYFAADLSAERGRFHGAIAGTERSRQFQSSHHHGCLEKQTELDADSDERQNHQPRPRTVVCHTSQQPQSGSLRRQPLGLRLQAEGGCSCDRRSFFAHSVEELVTAERASSITEPVACTVGRRPSISPGSLEARTDRQ
jgi:pimeloyl-ACP methyl ester carboxylesterase